MTTKSKNYDVERSVQFNPDRLFDFLEIYRDGKAYKHLVFLFLAFPLGVAYFVMLVTGISMGVGMAITLVGIPILLAVFWASRYLVKLELWLAKQFLDVEVERYERKITDEASFVDRVLSALRNADNWKGVGYLMLRFPMGLLSFIAATTVTALTFGLLTAPFTYMDADISVWFWTVDTFGEALVASVVGVFVGALALRFANFAASIWRSIITAILTQDEAPKAKVEPINDHSDTEVAIA